MKSFINTKFIKYYNLLLIILIKSFKLQLINNIIKKKKLYNSNYLDFRKTF